MVLEREGISDRDLADIAGSGVVGHVLAAIQIGLLCHFPVAAKKRAATRFLEKQGSVSTMAADSVINDIVGLGSSGSCSIVAAAVDDDDDEDDECDGNAVAV